MAVSMMFHDRRFAPLMWTQFFGALNDNVLKNALVVLLVFRGVELCGLKSESLVSFSTLVFIFPYFLFSALAGQLADKYDKSKIIQGIKLAEILIMVLAGLGFYLGNYVLLFFVLFLMGLHSAFFGPVKYSALPELISEERLVTANAYIELGTFLAILMGTMCGSYLISISGGVYLIIGVLFAVSVSGYLSSRAVPSIRAAAPGLRLDFNPWRPTWKELKKCRENRSLFHVVLGISWFWLLGAVILSLLPIIATHVIHGSEPVVTVFLAAFSIGVAVGSIFCEKVSSDQVEMGLVPFGALGMSCFLLDLAWVLSAWETSPVQVGIYGFWSHSQSIRIFLDLFGVAVSAGFFSVPLYTLVQQRSDRENRSRVIGVNNIVNSLFMVMGSVFLMGLYQLKVSIAMILVIFSVLNLAVAVYIYSLVPEFTLRFLAWTLSHCFYRVQIQGEKKIPQDGPAILVCNHSSFVDWLIVFGLVRRPVRFVMWYKFAKIPIFRTLIKHAGVILIAGRNEDRRILERAFVEISDALSQGELICLFPEGSLTRDGEIQEFKRGIEVILENNPVPVVPMALKGLWGSMFSHSGSRVKARLKRKLWHPVELRVGSVLEPELATASSLELKVRELAMCSD